MVHNEKFSSAFVGRSGSFCAALLRTLVIVAAVFAMGAGIREARADDTPDALAKYAGEFTYRGTREQGLAVVDKAWDTALADVNIIMRYMIKNQVKNQLIDKILIELPPGKIAVKLGDFEKVTGSIGKPEIVKSPDAKQSGKLTYEFDGKITQELVNDQGTITNVLELTPDGKTLHRSVKIKTDRLPKPVRYQLDYVRK